MSTQSRSRWESLFDKLSATLSWVTSETGSHFFKGFSKSMQMVKENQGDDKPGWVNKRFAFAPTAEALRGAVHESLTRAQVYWVADEMLQLLETAAKQMPPQPLRASDIPVSRGFVSYETPLELMDAQGKWLKIAASAWIVMEREKKDTSIEQPLLPIGEFSHGYRDGIVYLHFGSFDADFDLDEYAIDFIQDDPELYERVRREYPGYSLLHFDYWRFGDTAGRDRDDLEPPLDAAWHGAVLRRKMLAAFWTLSQQELAHTSEVRPPRPALKRFARATQKKREDIEPITIVTLRRMRNRSEEEHEGEGHPQPWSHRWIVSGHWRNQYYPSLGEHRYIWIHPYIKGPDDKPFVPKRKVYQWIR